MEKKKHEYSDNSSSQNKYGEWVPSIIEPWFGWKHKCMQGVDGKICGAKYKKYEDYRGHYALVHILGL